MSQFLIKSLSRDLCRTRFLGNIVPYRSWKVRPPWRTRKPRWLPTSPAKVFRIPVHPEIPPEEERLLYDLYVEYLRKVESLRNLIRLEYGKTSEQNIEDAEMLKKAEEDELKLCMLENDMENERIRLIREETMAKILEEKKQQLLLDYEKELEEKEQKRAVAEEAVRKCKAIVGQYVTAETLDEAIEYALDHPVNMNFTLDLQGNITWEGTPPKDYEERVNRRFENMAVK